MESPTQSPELTEAPKPKREDFQTDREYQIAYLDWYEKKVDKEEVNADPSFPE